MVQPEAIARAARATRRAIANISGVARTVSVDEHALSVSRFEFETLEIEDLDVPQVGSETLFEISMKQGVLYKPRSKENPSIDAFGVCDRRTEGLTDSESERGTEREMAFMIPLEAT